MKSRADLSVLFSDQGSCYSVIKDRIFNSYLAIRWSEERSSRCLINLKSDLRSFSINNDLGLGALEREVQSTHYKKHLGSSMFSLSFKAPHPLQGLKKSLPPPLKVNLFSSWPPLPLRPLHHTNFNSFEMLANSETKKLCVICLTRCRVHARWSQGWCAWKNLHMKCQVTTEHWLHFYFILICSFTVNMLLMFRNRQQKVLKTWM